jgi:hypothetical protein
MEFSEASRTQLLVMAKERIILPAEIDTAAVLASYNLQFGMGRLLHAVRTIVPHADVRFTASVDFTVTRSSARWGSGFSYGGLLELFTSGARIVAPEIRPNTCGVLVGALPTHMTQEELVERIVSVSSRFPPGAWDYSRRNHFVNVYRCGAMGRQIFFLHGCPEILRADQQDRPGLYPEHSSYWRSKLHRVQTPLGETGLLLDDEADAYWQTYQHSEELSKRDRMSTATEIFGEFEPLCNETHEGMASSTSYLLGCHLAKDDIALYPLMTTLGKPAYLVSGMAPNTAVSLLPHGTGYEFAFLPGECEVRCAANGSILFVFSGEAEGTQVFRDFTNIPFAYRSPAIVEQWERDEVLTIRNVLVPLVSTKV